MAPKRKTGRPTKRTDEVIQRIIDGLRQGTPLTIICDAEDMPCDRTVREWADADPELSSAIARAREAGFDRLAIETMEIIDTIPERTATEFGDKVDGGHVAWLKNRAEQRLKLLSKWDPKRYGDRLSLAGDEGAPIRLLVSSEDANL